MFVTGGDNDTVVNLTDGTDQDASFSVQNSDCTEALFYHTGQILLRNGCLKLLPVGDVIQQVTDMNTAVNRVGRRIRHFIDGVDGDIVLYAVYKPLKYRVMINPNGAEIDHIDHTGSSYNSFGITPFNRSDNGEYAADSGYNGSQATYINADYGVTISEYAVSRDKVPIGDAAASSYSGRLYYYVNGQYTSSDGPGVPSHLRKRKLQRCGYLDKGEQHRSYGSEHASFGRSYAEGKYEISTPSWSYRGWRRRRRTY